MSSRGFLLVDALLGISILALALIGWTRTFPTYISAVNALQSEVSAHAASTLEESILRIYRDGLLSEQNTNQTLSLPDKSSLYVREAISWLGVAGNTKERTVAVGLTDPNEQLESCDPFVSRDWREAELTAARSLDSSDLLRGFPSDTYRPSALAWHNGMLAIAIGLTGNQTSPTLFLLPMTREGDIGAALSGIDNATSSRTGYSDLVWQKGALLAANRFGSGSAVTCAQAAACAQLHIFVGDTLLVGRGTLELSTTSPPYARRVGGSSAGATTVAAQENIAVLGLEKTDGGMEINVIDISDLGAPRWISGISVGRSVNSIVLRGQRAFVATDDPLREVITIDLSNPYRPTIIGAWNAPGVGSFGVANDLLVYGGKLRLGRSYINNAPEFSVVPETGESDRDAFAFVDSGVPKNPNSVRALVAQDFLIGALGSRSLDLYAENYQNLSLVRSFSLADSLEGAALVCVGSGFVAGTFHGGTGAGYIQRIIAP